MEGLAELHTHLGGSVASDILWSLAHEQGIALPVKDYWEFDALVTVSDPRGVESLDALDGIYHWTELIQSSPLAVEPAVLDLVEQSPVRDLEQLRRANPIPLGLLERLEAAGAHVYVPRRDLDYALSVGLRMLRLRHLVDEKEGLFRAREAELPLLAYYANSISHLA